MVPFFEPEDLRNRSNLQTMSIPEMISELRDTFICSDFDVVEKILVSREATLKAEIEEKKKQIEVLEEKVQLERLDKLRVEMELKRMIEERKNGELGFGRCSGEVVKKRRVGDGVVDLEGERVLVKEKTWIGEQSKKNGVGASGELEFERCEVDVVKNRGEYEKVGALVGERRRAGEQRKKNGLGASGIGTVNDIGDNNEAECNLQTTLHSKETSSRVTVNTEHRNSSIVKKNLAARLAKPNRITQGDNFDQVDETLVVREAMLKTAIEEKVGELQENNQFKGWGRLNFEIEVSTVTGERCGEEFIKVGDNGNGFGLDDGKVAKAGVGHKKCKFEVLNNRGVGDGEACAVAGQEGERVEVLAETLVAREAMLKTAVKEKVGELQENNQFKSWGRLNFDIEVKSVTGERRGEEFVKVGEIGNGFGLDGSKVVKTGVGHEKGKLEVLKNRGVGDGDACAVAELEVGKVEVLAKKKRFVGELCKKGGLGASDTERQTSQAVQKNLDTRLTRMKPSEPMIQAAIEKKIMLLHEKNQFKSWGIRNFDVEAQKINGERCGEDLVKFRENVKGENVKVSAERKRLACEPSKKDGLGSLDTGGKSSFGAVQRNLAATLAEPNRILNRNSASSRGFAANLDILDGLGSDSSSSSSSSSSSGEFDLSSFNSNKKMKTNGSQHLNELLTKLNKGK